MSRCMPASSPEASAPARRDAAKQETRESLLAAAMAEFAERGLDAPSLDAICARAGFTRGAFYVHFRNREDLVAAVMERVLGAFLDAVVVREEGGDISAIVRRFASAVEALRDPRGFREPALETAWGAPKVPFHQVLAACQRSPALRARFVAILEEAVRRVAAAANPGASPDREGIAALLVLTAIGVRLALDLELPLDVPRVRDAALALLAAPRG
ncbi:MAG: TetR/AcrR family transcriptional regulator [Myxococcales bacterium]|nr:MAG: TetR/AcrR family transcriptional regulator [Myxococcales bacterium]